MPTKEEMKLQKEKLKLLDIGKKIIQIQSDIEVLEKKKLKKLNEMEKAKIKAEGIKKKIEELEAKISPSRNFTYLSEDMEKLPPPKD